MAMCCAASMHEISHDGCTPKQGNLATVFMLIVSIAWDYFFGNMHVQPATQREKGK
jgi:hypothetical protein